MNIQNKTKEVLSAFSDIDLPYTKSDDYLTLYKIVNKLLPNSKVDDVVFISVCLLYKLNNIDKNSYLKIVEEVRMRGLFTKLTSINRFIILLNNMASKNGKTLIINDLFDSIENLNINDMESIRVDDDMKLIGCNSNISKYIKSLYPDIDLSMISNKHKVKRYVDIVNEEI